MKVGVIGTGTMGKNHARIYSELKEVDSLYIYDLNQKAAQMISKPTGGILCDSIEKLLDAVDAVSICVPTHYHYDVALKCVDENIHFLLEKPICSSSIQAAKLLSEIPESLITGVGHIERFNPIVTEIRNILKNPLYIECKRHNPDSSRITDSTVVEDLMIHDIDVVFSLIDKSDYSIRAIGDRDICSVIIQFPGVFVHLSASRKSSKKIRDIYIEEESSTIEGNFMAQEIFIYKKPGQYNSEAERYVQENIIEKVLVNKLEPLKVELREFISSVKQKAPFPVSLQDGYNNLKICEEIRSQIKMK